MKSGTSPSATSEDRAIEVKTIYHDQHRHPLQNSHHSTGYGVLESDAHVEDKSPAIRATGGTFRKNYDRVYR